MSDVELLQEFKKRFNGSCLYEMYTNSVLDAIPLDRIKRFLDEKDLKVIKKPKRK